MLRSGGAAARRALELSSDLWRVAVHRRRLPLVVGRHRVPGPSPAPRGCCCLACLSRRSMPRPRRDPPCAPASTCCWRQAWRSRVRWPSRKRARSSTTTATEAPRCSSGRRPPGPCRPRFRALSPVLGRGDGTDVRVAGTGSGRLLAGACAPAPSAWRRRAGDARAGFCRRRDARHARQHRDGAATCVRAGGTRPRPFAGSLRRRRRPIAILYEPLSRISSADALSRVLLIARPGLRTAPQPLDLLWNARFALPAGEYRVQLTRADASSRTDTTLGVQIGRVGAPLEQWDVDWSRVGASARAADRCHLRGLSCAIGSRPDRWRSEDHARASRG